MPQNNTFIKQVSGGNINTLSTLNLKINTLFLENFTFSREIWTKDLSNIRYKFFKKFVFFGMNFFKVFIWVIINDSNFMRILTFIFYDLFCSRSKRQGNLHNSIQSTSPLQPTNHNRPLGKWKNHPIQKQRGVLTRHKVRGFRS